MYIDPLHLGVHLIALRYPEHKEVLRDKQGRYRTQSLFKEYEYQSTDYPPLWTLKEEDFTNRNLSTDKVELPSLKKLYMEIADPTEYEFAMQAFGTWKQWDKIKKSKALHVWIEDWAEELELKLRSEGIRGVVREADSGKNPLAAAKFLANADWNKTSNGRGRPTKLEIEKQTKIAARLNAEFEDDAERIGLVAITGGKS